MARNRHKKSQLKTPAPTSQPTESKPSAAAVQLASGIAANGSDYIEDHFIRIMIDSARLAEEPEFADVSMDPEKATTITENWLRKYNKRLTEAEKKGKETLRQVSDDMRIHIIDELATPGFRKLVKTRLKALNDRLMKTDDVKKLELAIVLQPMLEQKEIPWGICGLITTIYRRTIDPVIQKKQEDLEIMEGLAGLFKGAGNENVDFKAILKSPEKIDEAGQKLLQDKSGLYDLLEKKAWEMTERFENELLEGKIELDLFTEEELILPLTRLAEKTGEPGKRTHPLVGDPELFVDTCHQAITDIMTPERLIKLHKDVDAYEQRWRLRHPEWAATLHWELDYLEEEVYEQNKFVLAAFIGQMIRESKKHKAGLKAKK